MTLFAVWGTMLPMNKSRKNLKVCTEAHQAVRKLAADLDWPIGDCADKLILAACVRYERTVKELKALRKKGVSK